MRVLAGRPNESAASDTTLSTVKTNSLALTATLIAGAIALSGCSALRGAPDREDTFTTSYGECTAQWWLGSPGDSVPEQASDIAEASLAEADVTPESNAEWQALLVDSQSEGAEVPEDRLEGQAYIEVVREHVRNELDAGGYPDTERVIEVWSDLRCS
ncbi:hypothetical protein [Microbacterium sp. H1-D42]|uniref:hypothetical protein n=1 Tax=Microbacterium sp. H1-D42 TaxID=2925844 RepID=UPI001F534B0D|nr:hypothetical protein [Microbacterium sp. H1-D42]UNK72053.1 hypothetical protein MNR00_06320 [Microbacterium sp. H1-D42]